MVRLVQVGRELSTAGDLNSVLQVILGAAMELTGSEATSILELRLDGKMMRFLATRPEMKALESITVPLEGSVAGAAILKKKAVSLHDVANSPFHFKTADQLSGFKTRSILACPILFRGEALGSMEALNKKGGADYTEEDVAVLETLAAHAALAIQNARLQALVTKTQEEARRLEKMKNDFVAITSHELRTPLGLILGHSTFLKEIIGQEYQPQLGTIIKSAMRLKEIIDNMTRVDNASQGLATLRRGAVSVRKIILALVASMQAEARQKNITLDSDLDDSDLMMDGDAQKIQIALENLVRNSIDFTNTGGHVFIVARQLPEYVKISVVDDGIGIPARDVPHVFERFYQVESHLTRKHGGMGVGLSVAKVNVEMHGGRIWVESAEGKGSIFSMLLPLDSARGKSFITS